MHAQGKTCINDRNKYASHFLAYAFQSKERNSEHEALEKGDTGDLPSSDPGKSNGTYTLGQGDEPAAEAMGKGGQYQRLLLSIVILLGRARRVPTARARSRSGDPRPAPAAPAARVRAGRVADRRYFPDADTTSSARGSRSSPATSRGRSIYSLILAVTLAVCQALADATSNLGWLLAFALQATFLWMVFIQRDRLTSDLLAATAGPHAGRDGNSRLQTLYYATRLTQMARRRKPPKPPEPPEPPQPPHVEIHLNGLGGSPDPDSTPPDTPEEPA